MISRGYDNGKGTKFARFTMIKDIVYQTPDKAQWKEDCLRLLQDEDFGAVKIPMFEVERIDDLSLRVTSEYIKGRYVNRDELVTIRQFVVDRINAPDSEYSFSDFNANNYICERETNEIYNIDLDNYKRITVDERWDLFRKNVEQHERYQRWYGIDWSRTNAARGEPPDLNPENK